MKSRTDEVIKQLNRLVNDRSLATPTRNKIRDAVQHINKLQDEQTAWTLESETESETETKSEACSISPESTGRRY